MELQHWIEIREMEGYKISEFPLWAVPVLTSSHCVMYCIKHNLQCVSVHYSTTSNTCMGYDIYKVEKVTPEIGLKYFSKLCGK